MPKKTLEWDNWHSQLKYSIKNLESLKDYIHISDAEEKAIKACEGVYRWRITPYYASLMDQEDQNCPIRKQSVPNLSEFKFFSGAQVDPVEDRSFAKTRRVIHKYPDRVIFLVTDFCPVYCRHCARKFHTTDLTGTYYDKSSSSDWDNDFEYIEKTSQIRDVLLTGGDPLSLKDNALEKILKRLRKIPHIEIIRIGSRYPVVLPQRITKEFCEMLEKYHPVWVNTHFNHPKEITDDAATACDRLLRHGIPVQNQTVLLKGINDNSDIMRELVTKLLKIRVRPYYIYHCINAKGVSAFSTSLRRGRSIMRSLHGYTTGFAVPQYVLTTPLGKIPLWEASIFKENEDIFVTNYKKESMSIRDFLVSDEL